MTLRALALGAALLAGLASPPAGAGEGDEDVYLAPEAFLAEAFAGDVPEPEKLWITRELKPQVDDILGHDLGALRVSYWAKGARTAWVLEEIGKVHPITTGLVVDGGEIARITVLIYRESRGWEVRHPFFTDQFLGARLDGDLGLDRNIDGISGATLSVHALTRLARLALFLHAQVMAAKG